LTGTTAYMSDLEKWLDAHPEGISVFGLRHIAPDYREPGFLEFDEAVPLGKRQLELELESYRERHHPSSPSRFQSAFGFATFAEAKKFRANARRLNLQFKASSWEIDSLCPPHKADMNLIGFSPLPDPEYAMYWKGLTSNPAASDWELVIPLPIEFHRRVM